MVYETWCITCYDAEESKIEEEMEEGKEREKRILQIPKHKYIGETARSAYKHRWEHQETLRKLEEDSHLLKHVVNYHQGVPMDKIIFGMRVVQYTRTALERQVLESVLIQEEGKRHIIMNSKSEYSRCSIPRLTTKLGDKEYRKGRNGELEMEKEEEMRIRMEISRRRKEKCKERSKEMHPENQGERENPGHKRRKLEETGEYKTVLSKKQAVREESSQVGDKKVTKRKRIEKREGLETVKEPVQSRKQ